MNSNTNTGLYWFRHDLRVADNPTFNALCAKVDRLICVYCTDQDHELHSQLGEIQSSQAKHVFAQQSAAALDNELRLKHQYLLFIETPSVFNIVDLIQQHQVTHIGVADHPGVNEKQQIANLRKATPQVEMLTGANHCLFDVDSLPFELGNLPSTFSPFRKKVEKLPVPEAIPNLKSLPKAIEPVPPRWEEQPVSSYIQGGELAGHQQLKYYLFTTDFIRHYKQTRNALDNWDSSSKLSFWLANGCLSPRTAYHSIKDYEDQRGENDSTYWLYFELLWREYFQWYLSLHQKRLFQFAGVKQIKPDTHFDQQQFIRWCEGMTAYPIINACMRQLNATGYMSNRGRQLVASCLVHELGLDWRFGAAYFEKKLIDYDVASNWGNWQYLAGVGADPRGHRRFDLQKQAQIYDPNGDFTQKWLSSDG